jgi:hypothetical protein
MSFPSRVDTVYANEIACTPVDSDNFNIVNTKGGEILLNGVAPGGGGGSLPIIGTGDISVTGNITANGDGIDNGKLEAQTIKSIDNIVISSGSLEVITGGVDIKANGNMTLEGNGNINQQGTGKITSGTGGIEGKGEIKTNATNDIHSGKDLVFDGQDIYKSYPGIVPPIANKTYKDYKGLVGKNDNNIFTGSNQFNSNTTEFAAKVSVGTRDGGGLFTQNLALNTSGNIESKTINNGTLIQCGNINCGNAGLNEVRAREFKTRTNENNSPEGWTISQEIPSVPAQNLDRSLVMKGGEANAFISILDSAHSGFVPNIVLDPRTSALGGLIASTTHQVGQGAEAFKLEQPNTGAESNNLLIKAGSNEGQVKFQNNAGNIDLAIIQKDSITNQGRLYCPAIYFGTTGIHNSIVNDTSGADSLVLKIRQATASSKVEFLDNNNASVMEVKKDEIELGPDIPILYGAYSFRPQQYTFNFTGAIIDDNPSLVLFNSGTALWTNINDTGAPTQTLHQIGENFFKMTIIGGASSGGSYGAFRFTCDFPFMIPNYSPAVPTRHFDGNFSIKTIPNTSVYPRLCGFSGTSTDFKLCWIGVPAGTETFDGIIRITILNT